MNNDEYNIFNLITQAQLGLEWIQETSVNINKNDTIYDKLQQFLNKNERIIPFNQGVLLMASYMYFVLPKQSIFNKLSIKGIDTSKFIIKEGKNSPKEILRRVRNSLAHGNVFVNDDEFIFKDRKDANSPFTYIVAIKFSDFGNFINNYYFELKKCYFSKQKI